MSKTHIGRRMSWTARVLFAIALLAVVGYRGAPEVVKLRATLQPYEYAGTPAMATLTIAGMEVVVDTTRGILRYTNHGESPAAIRVLDVAGGHVSRRGYLMNGERAQEQIGWRHGATLEIVVHRYEGQDRGDVRQVETRQITLG
ncbi:hypothetical protein HN371_03715 [Candidatus Poribacteria bacterium]|jgi:hypothetical protein|nr:hypothetical protein [Candidatus Poribacteria bacterium]MBT5531614.1 hypothetical protein [Candidatus Poribacteria bacterium]MBT5714405.1 hypothetical protein [Candidatus Poribacteria bacterium]MBT7097167.1 hypothetical protein [Candidatus Poribacteria bacterium]MBT7803999.1 hypothetical protein [Candidatus Poribacteria bacterium]